MLQIGIAPRQKLGEGNLIMKLLSKIGLFCGITTACLALVACGGTTTRTTTYTANVVTPVVPYTVTTTTTYRTKVYKRPTCVDKSYYNQTYCTNSWQVTGYRNCGSKQYTCW